MRKLAFALAAAGSLRCADSPASAMIETDEAKAAAAMPPLMPNADMVATFGATSSSPDNIWDEGVGEGEPRVVITCRTSWLSVPGRPAGGGDHHLKRQAGQ